jgi:hypothetical protein
VDVGRYDVTTLISPALAAALEAAPEGGDEVVEGVMQQLNDAVERLERGQGGWWVLPGGAPGWWKGRGGAPLWSAAPPLAIHHWTSPALAGVLLPQHAGQPRCFAPPLTYSHPCALPACLPACLAAAGLKGDGPASLDDLHQVAEAIDLYFQ